jgi:uncharacterized integral membrane protein
MRILLGILVMGFGFLFLVENDQQSVSVTIPFWGKTGPLSIGSIAIISVFIGIILAVIASLLKKAKNRVASLRTLNPPPTHTDLGHHG